MSVMCGARAAVARQWQNLYVRGSAHKHRSPAVVLHLGKYNGSNGTLPYVCIDGIYGRCLNANENLARVALGHGPVSDVFKHITATCATNYSSLHC